MSRHAQSGLRLVTRDWSESNSQFLPSSQEIPWDSSPPQAKPLTGSQKRLKAIQDALAGNFPASKDSKPLTPSTSANKRSSPSQDAQHESAPKKPRNLPPSWVEPEPSLSSSTWGSSARGRSTSDKPVSRSINQRSDTRATPVTLSQEQTQILTLVEGGTSVFYTGSAGTGKSVLLREIIKTLRRKHSKSADAVAITASTGIAACNIGGVTVHSFAGIGLGIESAEVLAQKVRKNRKASSRWLRTQVLIVDEVSMVDGELFDKLSKVGCIVRNDPRPFGGLQLIVTGDFFQLPPVAKGMNQVKFAFEAQMWDETVQRTFNLTKVFRQRDEEFVAMLNEMRFGKLSMKSIARFRALSRPVIYEDGLLPTELFPRREDVDRSNSVRMQQLAVQKEEVFKAIDGGSIQDPLQRSKMLANFMAPELLVLRAEAQVMLIKNVDEMLVNGSIGRVVRFADPALYGTELDEGPGPGGEVKTNIKTSEKKDAKVGTDKRFPVVEFPLPHGGRRMVLVTPEVWKVELPSGEIQVSRTQLPLILAWAMSIHKSQGQTLERVKVDLGKVFERGQAYVALSRATSLKGLQVLNFDPKKVTVHPKVVEWSKTLETISE